MRLLFVWLIAIVLMGGGYFMYTTSDDSISINLDTTTASSNAQPQEIKNSSKSDVIYDVDQINRRMRGDIVTVKGKVAALSEGKGHVFTTFKDCNKDEYLKVVMFAKTSGKLPERKQLLEDAYEKDYPVYVKGKVDVYKGELEVIAFKVYTK